jgi:hypothetical protein
MRLFPGVLANQRGWVGWQGRETSPISPFAKPKNVGNSPHIAAIKIENASLPPFGAKKLSPHPTRTYEG